MDRQHERRSENRDKDKEISKEAYKESASEWLDEIYMQVGLLWRIFGYTFCLRINLGWKLWCSREAGSVKQFVFSVNPFMGYSQVKG